MLHDNRQWLFLYIIRSKDYPQRILSYKLKDYDWLPNNIPNTIVVVTHKTNAQHHRTTDAKHFERNKNYLSTNELIKELIQLSHHQNASHHNNESNITNNSQQASHTTKPTTKTKLSTNNCALYRQQLSLICRTTTQYQPNYITIYDITFTQNLQ
jgi:hypothetical protein